MSKTLIAYHGDPELKAQILRQLARHRVADQLVQGQYWACGKGCAVGCTIYGDDHTRYEDRFGIPAVLAHIEDRIFEGMSNREAMEWPERFMGAITPGSDLSPVAWKLLHWLLTDEKINPGITHPDIRAAVKLCADVVASTMKGEQVSEGRVHKVLSEIIQAEHLAGTFNGRKGSDESTRNAYYAAQCAYHTMRAVKYTSSLVMSTEAFDCDSVADNTKSAVDYATHWGESSEISKVAYSRIADKLIELLKGA